MNLRISTALLVMLAALPCTTQAAPEPGLAVSPQSIADELLAADRAFSMASTKTDAVRGLAAQFSEDVVMPVRGKGFAHGKTAVIAELEATAENANSRVEWTPVRVGISADGRQGFTFGSMTQHKADGTQVPLKYMSYWKRESAGWRVIAYKRARRAASATGPLDMLPAKLPARIVSADADAAALAQHAQSLDRIERAFSDEAQAIGLAAAFARYGSADAVNMGGPDDTGFVLGAEAIGRAVGAGEPAHGSSVSWSPDRVVVAGSGDLGVTIGMIRRNTPPADAKAPAAFPFFTIWHRSTPEQPWRYIAE